MVSCLDAIFVSMLFSTSLRLTYLGFLIFNKNSESCASIYLHSNLLDLECGQRLSICFKELIVSRDLIKFVGLFVTGWVGLLLMIAGLVTCFVLPLLQICTELT